MESKYVKELLESIKEFTNEARLVGQKYIELGETSFEKEELIEDVDKLKGIDRLREELKQVERMTYEEYMKEYGYGTEEDFKEWKDTRIKIMKENIQNEKQRLNELGKDMKEDYTHVDDEYEKNVEKLNEKVEKINKKISRNITRLEIRVEEISEELENLHDKLIKTSDLDEKKNLSNEIKSLHDLKAIYDGNIERLNKLQSIPEKLASNVTDFDVLGETLKESEEIVSEIENSMPVIDDEKEIEINVTYNPDTNKYVVSLKCGNYELKPGKEFSEEELTKENINRLLKGFVGSIANNKVVINANNKKISNTDLKSAAESIIKAGEDLKGKKQEEVTVENEPEKDIEEPKVEDELEKDIEEPKVEDELEKNVEKPTKANEETVSKNTDPVVLQVTKARNFEKKVGVAAAAVGTALLPVTLIAGAPLLAGVGAAAIVGGIGNWKNIARKYKDTKTRKKLQAIAKKAGLKYQVDRNTGSIYFCIDGLDTRVTSVEQINELKKQGYIAEDFDIERELDAAFNNALRGTASDEQKAVLNRQNGVSKVDLALCDKVTLDNLEAAFQQDGGVYSRNEQSKWFKQLNPEKIAEKFKSSLKPKENTEAEVASVDEVLEEEKVEEKEQEESIEEPQVEAPEIEEPSVQELQMEEQKVEQPQMEEPKMEESAEELTNVSDVDMSQSFEDLFKELDDIGLADELLNNEEEKGMKL